MSNVIAYGDLQLARLSVNEQVAVCSTCNAPLQRTSTGNLADGVVAHYQTVHPEKGIRA